MGSRKKTGRSNEEAGLFDDVAEKTINSATFATDPNHVMKARNEALDLYQALVPLDLLPAEAYLKDHPPSPGAIAFLAFLAQEIYVRSEASRRASHPRRNSLQAQIRDGGFSSYKEVREKAPHLIDDRGKKRVMDAISRVKRQKKSP